MVGVKVAVIEDDSTLVEAVSLCFRCLWPEVDIVSATEGEEGVKLVKTESPDVIILDIGLPDMDGFEVLTRIRHFSNVPVIILTIMGEEMDKVRGLELGADEYITKPFDHKEFITRVKKVLSRSQLAQPKRANESIFTIGGLKINFATKEVTVNGKFVYLTSMEYDLLCHLAKNKGKMLTPEALLDKIGGKEYSDGKGYLKLCIQCLRNKLDKDPNHSQIILEQKGEGYKFVGL